MSPLAIGPLISLLGIIAVLAVIRTRAQTKKSMYSTLRESRALELKKARQRATDARAAQEQAAREQEAAAAREEQDRIAAENAAATAAATAAAAAAAASAPPVPSSTAPVAPPPAEPAYSPPAYVPPADTPPEPAKPSPDIATPAAETPQTTPAEPAAATGPAKASWEIVEPVAPGARPLAGVAATADKADWELDTAERRRDVKKKKEAKVDDFDDENEKESLAQVVLSYAGLVAALLVILLGILFMVGARAST